MTMAVGAAMGAMAVGGYDTPPMPKPPGRATVSDSAFLSDAPILPLIEMERQAILRALEFTKGDRGVAAHLLGIGRTTLYRKLKEYQVAV
jgi:DNA-binding NtrC family response regulator